MDLTSEQETALNDQIERAKALMQSAKSAHAKEDNIEPIAYKKLSVLAKEPPLQWLIERFIPERSLCVGFGANSSFKTFALIDMVCCCGMEKDFHGFKTKKAHTLYILSEGKGDIVDRVRAWCIGNNVSFEDLEDKIIFITTPAPLDNKDMVSRIIKTANNIINCGDLPSIEIIVIDTVNRNLLGDENSTQAMAAYVAGADRLREALDAATIHLHHTGHGEGIRSRGSSALPAAADAECAVIRSTAKGKNGLKVKLDDVMLYVTKLRSGKEGAELSLYAEEVVVDPEDLRTSRYLVEKKAEEEDDTPADYEDEVKPSPKDELLMHLYYLIDPPKQIKDITIQGVSQKVIYTRIAALKEEKLITDKLVITKKGKVRLKELRILTARECTEVD
jgi:RecA-family ATPase